MNRKLKTLIKLAIYTSPQWLQHYLHRKVEKREALQALERVKRTKVSKEELVYLINSLDLDCDVMLHTSMMSIGKLQGGVKFIANEFIHKVDISQHTLMVSALPYRGAFREYLENKPVFDVRNAPVAMGAINEYFAMLPEARRSLHPTHSVIALGKRAEEYVSSHHRDETPFGMHSPYFKLIKNRGKVILFGATLNNLTLIHAIEDMLGEVYPFKVYSRKAYVVDCINIDGEVLKVKTVCHAPVKGMIRDLTFTHDKLIKNEIMFSRPIGESELCVLDAYRFCIYYLELLTQGVSIYGKFHPKQALIKYIQKLKKEI